LEAFALEFVYKLKQFIEIFEPTVYINEKLIKKRRIGNILASSYEVQVDVFNVCLPYGFKPMRQVFIGLVSLLPLVMFCSTNFKRFFTSKIFSKKYIVENGKKRKCVNLFFIYFLFASS